VNYLQFIASPEALLQWGVVLIAVLTALYTRRLIFRLLSARGQSSQGLRKVAIRSAERILWPLSMLLMLWLGTLVLRATSNATDILEVAMPLAGSFALVRISVYLLRKSIRGGPLLKASEGFIAGLIWLVLGLHLLGWLPQAMAMLDGVGMDLGNLRLSLLSGLKLTILIIAALTIAGWISHLIEHRLMGSHAINASAQVSLVKFIKIALITIAVLMVLGSVGIDISTLAVFGGALGVGLGFGLQRIAANFISGFIVIMDRSIKPGDIITVGENFGWVQELKSRYIVVRSTEGVDTLIPNEMLITNEVINWSYADRNVRMKIDVGISYDNDPEKAMDIVLGCAFASERVLKDPSPAVSLKDFADSGITIELRVWLSDPENGFENIRSKIRVAIWKAFKENEITIPYPQRDLHLKSISDPVRQELRKATD